VWPSQEKVWGPLVMRMSRNKKNGCEQPSDGQCFVVVDASPHIVRPLAGGPIDGERPAVQAGGHFEDLDELRRSHTTGALRHDAGEAHHPLHFDL